MHQNSPLWEPKAKKFSVKGAWPPLQALPPVRRGHSFSTSHPFRHLNPRAYGARPQRLWRLVHTACSVYPLYFSNTPLLITDYCLHSRTCRIAAACGALQISCALIDWLIACFIPTELVVLNNEWKKHRNLSVADVAVQCCAIQLCAIECGVSGTSL